MSDDNLPEIKLSDAGKDSNMAPRRTPQGDGRIIYHGTGNNPTFTLPDPHLTAAGTIITVAKVGQWECVHEGDHAFWETVATGDVCPPGC